jgi:hypothetical protein
LRHGSEMDISLQEYANRHPKPFTVEAAHDISTGCPLPSADSVALILSQQEYSAALDCLVDAALIDNTVTSPPAVGPTDQKQMDGTFVALFVHVQNATNRDCPVRASMQVQMLVTN